MIAGFSAGIAVVLTVIVCGRPSLFVWRNTEKVRTDSKTIQKVSPTGTTSDRRSQEDRLDNEFRAWAAIGRARYHHDNEEYDKAIQLLDEAIELQPTLVHAFRRKAWCYFEQRQYEKANEIFSLALKIEPNNADIQVDQAFAFTKMQRYQAALQCLDRVIASNPANLKALRLRADVHFELGDKEKARADRDALWRVPTDEGAGANADAQSEVNSEAKQNVIRTESGDKGRNSENKPHDIPGASDAKSDRSNKE